MNDFFKAPQATAGLQMESVFPFQLQPLMAEHTDSKLLASHEIQIKSILSSCIPYEELADKEKYKEWLEQNIPLIHWDERISPPDNFSIYLLCKSKKTVNIGTIFLELVRRYLIPGKELQLLSFFNANFSLPDISSDLYFTARLDFLVEDGRDFTKILQHLPQLSRDVIHAISSSEYASYLFNAKSLNQDEKISLVHEELLRYMVKTPQVFDAELLKEMSRFLALSPPQFCRFRTSRHLSRLVASHYLLRKKTDHALRFSQERRHLEVKCLSSKLHFPFGSKPVLGLAIGVGIFEKYEFLEDYHVIYAVQKYISSVQIVKNSFYSYQVVQDNIRLIYLELEKKDGSLFSTQEIQLLKSVLAEELKKRIEKLAPAIFMVRNEEETMKSVLLLSEELKALADLPQVMISLDKQGASDLSFTVILVHLLKDKTVSMEECFNKLQEKCLFIPEKVQIIGYLRKKFPKEANIFHLKIPKEHAFLRADSSLNFYLARQKIVRILVEAIGEFRDYNGGLILKQAELFSQFKQLFKEIEDKQPDLLENFFFSISPIEAQATLPLSYLQSLFGFMLECLELPNLSKQQPYLIKSKKDEKWGIAVIRAREKSCKVFLEEALQDIERYTRSFIKTEISYQENYLACFIFEPQEDTSHDQLTQMLENALKDWLINIRSQQVLRLSFMDLPVSLDPRQAGDESASTILKMLFDGLMRIERDSKPAYAVAESCTISPDGKKYIFKIRKCFWSNGDPVVAYDFEYSWKKILSPIFFTPFSYFFFPIKNAQAAKGGKASLDEVGVKAIDDDTLEVHLENPTPEFLELTAYPLYAPVNHRVDQLHPNWVEAQQEEYVCNGPFKIHRRLINGYEFRKNFHYWDKDAVKLEQILISKNNALVANELFQKDEIDWIGRPMFPWEHLFSKGAEEQINAVPLSVNWLTFNTERFPFNNKKIRKAFFYAINSEEIIKTIPYHGLPGSTPLPLIHTQIDDPDFNVYNPELAVKLFNEGLKELGMALHEFPVITLLHTTGKVREITVKRLKQQLQNILKITCRNEAYEFNLYFRKLLQGDFQLGMLPWKSWIDTPIYTLNTFKYRNNTLNVTRWEHPEYIALLDKAEQELDSSKRFALLKAAEYLLIEDVPICTLCYEFLQYMHKKHLKAAFFSKAGNVDFKWAYINQDGSFGS